MCHAGAVVRASKGTATEVHEEGTMLLTAEEALAGANRGGATAEEGETTERPQREEDIDADSVFASLKSLKGNNQDDDE